LSDCSTSESYKQVIQLVCAEPLETLIAKMKRSFDSPEGALLGDIRASQSLTRMPAYGRGGVASLHACHLPKAPKKLEASLVSSRTEMAACNFLTNSEGPPDSQRRRANLAIRLRFHETLEANCQKRYSI
jgi:hypothetical protein